MVGMAVARAIKTRGMVIKFWMILLNLLMGIRLSIP
jgi:hypothetical protein